MALTTFCEPLQEDLAALVEQEQMRNPEIRPETKDISPQGRPYDLVRLVHGVNDLLR